MLYNLEANTSNVLGKGFYVCCMLFLFLAGVCLRVSVGIIAMTE